MLEKQDEHCCCYQQNICAYQVCVCLSLYISASQCDAVQLTCSCSASFLCFNVGFTPHWVFTLLKHCPAEDGSPVAVSSVFCSCAFAMISKKKVLGCVAIATPDGAPLDCGSVSRSKPPCKQSMLTAC